MAQKRETAVNDDTGAERAARQSKARSNTSAFAEPFSFSIFNTAFNGTPDKTMEKMMSQSKNQFEKFTQESGAFGREGMEAFMQAGTIFMKGCEEIFRAGTALAQSSAEKQAEFIKEAMSSKTLNEWTEVQNKAAQANFDDFMSGATQISELSVKLMTEATEPLNTQATKAIKKASESMAA